MTCILAALDLGPATEAVLATAADLARAFTLPVHLVTALGHHKPEKAEHAMGTDHKDYAKEIRRIRNALAMHSLRLQSDGITVERHSANGDAAEVICALAEEHAARYIVLGAREPSALRHLVAKSVPAEVVRHSAVPVIFAGDWQRIRALPEAEISEAEIAKEA